MVNASLSAYDHKTPRLSHSQTEGAIFLCCMVIGECSLIHLHIKTWTHRCKYFCSSYIHARHAHTGLKCEAENAVHVCICQSPPTSLSFKCEPDQQDVSRKRKCGLQHHVGLSSKAQTEAGRLQTLIEPM